MTACVRYIVLFHKLFELQLSVGPNVHVEHCSIEIAHLRTLVQFKTIIRCGTQGHSKPKKQELGSLRNDFYILAYLSLVSPAR